MRRREFIAPLGGAAAWPLAARAQQRERMRRIGVLVPQPRTIESQARTRRSCRGWRNWAGPSAAHLRIDSGGAEAIRRFRSYAAELVALAPDVILAGSSIVGRCYRPPAPCPSCSFGVADPVGAGFVDSLARPGGNATGLPV